MAQPALDGGNEHAHLRLARTLDPMPRRKSNRRVGRDARNDHESHARDIARQITGVRDQHERGQILGVHPDLVLVIEFQGSAANLADRIEQAGLRALGLVGHTALTAFSNDPELREFLDQCEGYRTGTTPAGNPKYLDLFVVIERVRPLEPSDVVDADVAEHLDTVAGDELVRLDFECWCTDDVADARRRHEETEAVLNNAGARVLDRTSRYAVGLAAIRADIPAGQVWDVVSVQRVSRVRLLPRPALTQPELIRWSADDLPVVSPPPDAAPKVAVIDSGAQAGHPLLEPAMWEATSAVDGLTDGADQNGHGTMVASLALYGSLDVPLRDRAPLQAAGKLVSIRVLDHEGRFPEECLWERHLEQALKLAADSDARVINLSIGDDRHPYWPPAPTGLAGVLDQFARERDVVLVVSSGNFLPDAHTREDFAAQMLNAEAANLASPAMAALALTVGALVPKASHGVQPARETVSVVPLGTPDGPSPVSRTGPGIENAIKPELAAPGGTYVYDRDRASVRTDAALGKVVGAAGGRPDALLARDVGTSFAAPLVTHAALRVLRRYPSLSANAVRALVLASAYPATQVLADERPKRARAAQRMLTGFGQVSPDEAERSTDHRAVLLAEEALLPDQVHFYTVRVPEGFFQTGDKRVSASLAFAPRTRASRLRYLERRMSVFVYRGRPVDEVRSKFALTQGEPPDDLDSAKVKELEPSDNDRLLGANQAATAESTQKWDRRYDELTVVVRNTDRWGIDSGTPEQYALAVVLEVEQRCLPIYAELNAQLEALSEAEVEIELG